MTVSSVNTKNSYSANGSLTSFTYTFPINSSAELKVIERSTNGTETIKTLNSHYSITDNGSQGGQVNFNSAPANGVTVVLLRDTTLTQETDYIANDPFGAETHEAALDKLTLQQQELQEELDRSIKLSRTNTMSSTEFTVGSTDRSGKILGFDTNGELVVSQELGSFKGNWSASTSYDARDIVKDTSTNNIFLCNQGHTSSGTQPLTTNTDSGKWDLLVDAAASTTAQTAAASSASAAATSETNAASSAASALSHKNDSETAKTASETAKTAAETARTAAQTAQAAAEAALDTFDDRFLGAKSSDPSVDNDGNALIDGALYFSTNDDVMKVYDLTNTQWRQLALSGTNQTNVNTVATQISPTNNISTVAGLNSQITNLSGLSTELTNLNNIRTDISGVNTISAAVSAVNSNSANINAVNNNSSNINTLAGISGLSTLAANNANVTTVANNLTSVNNFAEQYRIASSAPTTSLNVGDLYFDTSQNELKVYKSSGWAAAGSTVNGTAQRFTYNITGTPTTVSGADANGNTLAYDAGFADVYVNGVRMSSADITITSGTSVVFASALANGDVVDVVAYGTFNVASIDAANIDSGTLNNARLTGSGAITINGSSVALGGNITVGETKPTISSISPSTITNAQTSITITGTNFVSVPQVEALNQSTGIWYTADTISFTNATTLVATFTLSVDAQYKLRIENPDGNAVLSSSNILTVSDAPTWSTSAGSLGTFAGNFSGTLATVSASSDSTVAYSETTSVLTGAGVTLNTSTGALTTTDFGASSTTPTTYNFTIRATDGEGQTTDRSFSMTSNFGATGGGQFN